jgi:hypothetical protein
MSRTRRRAYTRSKRFDRSCRNAGSCPWCRRARIINDLRLRDRVRDALREGRDTDEHITLERTATS